MVHFVYNYKRLSMYFQRTILPVLYVCRAKKEIAKNAYSRGGGAKKKTTFYEGVPDTIFVAKNLDRFSVCPHPRLRGGSLKIGVTIREFRS